MSRRLRRRLFLFSVAGSLLVGAVSVVRRVVIGPPGLSKGKARVREYLEAGELWEADNLLTKLVVLDESDPELKRLQTELGELIINEAKSEAEPD